MERSIENLSNTAKTVNSRKESVRREGPTMVDMLCHAFRMHHSVGTLKRRQRRAPMSPADPRRSSASNRKESVQRKGPSMVDMLCRAFVLVALLVSSKALAKDAPQSKEIRVGDRAPLFTLKDQHDREFSLEHMVKKGPVAVVFVRSVSWCSYCQLQTVQLSQNLEKVQATGGQVVVVCYDAPDKVKRFAERREIKIPVLCDPDSKTIEAYGMRAMSGSGEQLGSAQHGTFVIDQSGIVRSKPYLTSFEGDGVVDALATALKEAKGSGGVKSAKSVKGVN